MVLALNNLQRLICHKYQPTNQPNFKYVIVILETRQLCTKLLEKQHKNANTNKQ